MQNIKFTQKIAKKEEKNMSAANSKNEWLNQADNLLRQINTNRLDISKLFPSKEHMQAHIKLTPELRKNFSKFFTKPLNSLVGSDTI